MTCRLHLFSYVYLYISCQIYDQWSFEKLFCLWVESIPVYILHALVDKF